MEHGRPGRLSYLSPQLGRALCALGARQECAASVALPCSLSREGCSPGHAGSSAHDGGGRVLTIRQSLVQLLSRLQQALLCSTCLLRASGGHDLALVMLAACSALSSGVVCTVSSVLARSCLRMLCSACSQSVALRPPAPHSLHSEFTQRAPLEHMLTFIGKQYGHHQSQGPQARKQAQAFVKHTSLP